ncbi:hypothetical protein UlMin_027892 [Ulmus minor]
MLPLLLVVLLVFPAAATAISDSQTLTKQFHQFGPFNQSYYNYFAVVKPATISNDALQITPDSVGNFPLANRSGRVLFNQSFKLWTNQKTSTVASFNTSFLLNIYRVNTSITPGEGLAFVVAPNLDTPENSDGEFLGLTNKTTDGNSSNHLLAVELDTFKQDFDPDNNHLGLDINSIRSVKTVSLSDLGIEIAPPDTRFYVVWIDYNGGNQELNVFMANQTRNDDGGFVIEAKPTEPVLSYKGLDLRKVVSQDSYFGFSASTGSSYQLNCVLRWNLTVEILPGSGGGGGGGGSGEGRKGVKIGVGVAAGVAILLVGLGVLGWCLYRRRRTADDPTILGALKSLPGTPREFEFRELKKATNSFDEKNKLGEGGFGVVYRGILTKENVEIAVKRFSRENLKGKDDFLAELTIINRLRHKHLVKLLGWCHKNSTLLLVYDYMPNGSLDNHLFSGLPEKAALSWRVRYKILSGVASALHYLHNEYDQKVLHRDLKASNIMLDSEFNARLGDFGLARAIDNEKTSYAEMEGVQGTMGYIAPECFHTGKATRESDIYGFGAVVLEVVCGQRPWTKNGSFQLLLDWVWWLHREGQILKAVDERLGNDYIEEEAERLLLLGLACSHPNAAERPKTQAILQILSGSMAPPHVAPFKPAFVWPSTMPTSSISDRDGVTNSFSITNSITTGTSSFNWQVRATEDYSDTSLV